jgi:hypothetical protein
MVAGAGSTGGSNDSAEELLVAHVTVSTAAVLPQVSLGRPGWARGGLGARGQGARHEQVWCLRQYQAVQPCVST